MTEGHQHGDGDGFGQLMVLNRKRRTKRRKEAESLEAAGQVCTTTTWGWAPSRRTSGAPSSSPLVPMQQQGIDTLQRRIPSQGQSCPCLPSDPCRPWPPCLFRLPCLLRLPCPLVHVLSSMSSLPCPLVHVFLVFSFKWTQEREQGAGTSNTPANQRAAPRLSSSDPRPRHFEVCVGAGAASHGPGAGDGMLWRGPQRGSWPRRTVQHVTTPRTTRKERHSKWEGRLCASEVMWGREGCHLGWPCAIPVVTLVVA